MVPVAVCVIVSFGDAYAAIAAGTEMSATTVARPIATVPIRLFI
jgi:hypothetical protein